MTREAEQVLLRKARAGLPITPADHITTLDCAEEIDAFRKGLSDNGRLTEELIQACARRKIQIARHDKNRQE